LLQSPKSQYATRALQGFFLVEISFCAEGKMTALL
jgi:hypothetical protein